MSTTQVLLWLTLVVLIGWSLGGYNRLVRLRARVIETFVPVDGRLGQAIDLLATLSGHAQASGDAVSESTGARTDRETEADALRLAASAGLAAAAAQLSQSLQVARRQPLDADAVAALGTAYVTLHAAWQRMPRDAAAPDSDTGTGPAIVQRAWDDRARMARDAMDSFNSAVLAYNAAIAQFPALLIAQVFGFRPAACL